MWRQRRNLVPPGDQRIDGQTVLTTGGNGGIGYATAAALLDRGARVVVACRDRQRADQAVEQLRQSTGGDISSVRCDLADLNSVRSAGDEIRAQATQIDAVVLNAGVWPQKYDTTQQGHEIAFGVNVLGHFAMCRELLEQRTVRPGGRIVWVTGDIYVAVKECTSDYTYRGALGGMIAYCRSKLGNLWLRSALADQYRDYRWYAVHPGVVATNLSGSSHPWLLRKTVLITPDEGAWTTTRCVTATDAVPGYYHNTRGLVTLGQRDPASNDAAAGALFERCRELAAPT